MAFNSISFFAFFTGTLLVHALLSGTHRWRFQLIVSLVFYMMLDAGAMYILLGSCVLDYYLCSKISEQSAKARFYLFISLLINLSLLFGYKYFNLFISSTQTLFSIITQTSPSPRSFDIIAPIGVSFFCFKKMSCAIDIYRKEARLPDNFGMYLLYVSHFLEIISGPIDRVGKLTDQLISVPDIDLEKIRRGIFLILLGLFMKVVVADRLAIYTDAVFNNVQHHYGSTLIVAAYFYSFQIYCDFCGYTNIALGCGNLLGLRLAPNFNLPYMASSIADFWRRWHMSLSYWFRDYLYIPLGGNRVSIQRQYLNYLIIFVLCGLWHGANWTFVVWGALHSVYQIFWKMTRGIQTGLADSLRMNAALRKLVSIFVTFHLVTFGWIFFRANSMTDALTFISHMFEKWPPLFKDQSTMLYGAVGIFVIFVSEILLYKNIISFEKIIVMPRFYRWCIYYLLIFSIILAGIGSDSAFIYNQF